jgi:hypothetical protein
MSTQETRSTEPSLKDIIIDYVGTKLKPAKDEVTVEHVASVLADEFPDFVLSVAEENWINGYTQALNDVDFMLQQQRFKAKEEKQKNKKP